MSWNDLSDRQKSLDKAIDGCGVKLDYSDACVKKVAIAIGASSSEYSFIKQRIALHLKAQSLIQSSDTFIDKTEKMLDQFAKDDEEWKRKGRALGFDFWKD